ncbi:hypothetical protein C6P40_000512 [Pichia californica]|uniref:Histone acetyltransferase n=1 Tax=Pichia californica TaxID=460514 RepID=A0A9P6WN81_9ASCO|nr:hypothetical protein C6P40_000512 [[Candida] californica]
MIHRTTRARTKNQNTTTIIDENNDNEIQQQSTSTKANLNDSKADISILSDSSFDNIEILKIKKKKRQITPRISKSVLNKKRIIYPKVNSVLLELPYRGLFEFSESNTFDTIPDENFKNLFKDFVKKSINLNKNSNNILNCKLKYIHFDNYEIDAWYKSPYPSQYNNNSIIFICPHCLTYFNSSFTLNQHLTKCSFKTQPAGREIYRDSKENISVFEIDGRKNVIFCQNLCLLAKLFLNSKTLYYDVEPFMFYVLYDFSSLTSFKFVGYFSKEKLNSTGYNLSCIMTLPIYQRRGFGNFLIDFSYLLSKREFKLGTPEKPLSDLGLLSYRNYWKLSVIREIYKLLFKTDDKLKFNKVITNVKDSQLKEINISIDDLSNLTGMCHNDVIFALEQLHSLITYKYDDKKINKFALIFNPTLVKQLYTTWVKKTSVKLNNDYLIWKPIILGPSGGINTNSTMVIADHNNTDSPISADSNSYDGQLMKNISVIVNFLKDDLEDDRDLEDQFLEKIIQQNEKNNSELNSDKKDLFENSRVSYPGIKFIIPDIIPLNKSDKCDDEIIGSNSKSVNRNDGTSETNIVCNEIYAAAAADDEEEEQEEDDGIEEIDHTSEDGDYASNEDAYEAEEEDDDDDDEEEDDDYDGNDNNESGEDGFEL